MKYVEFNKKVSTLLELVSAFEENSGIVTNFEDTGLCHSELIEISYYIGEIEHNIYYFLHSDNFIHDFRCVFTEIKGDQDVTTYFDTFEQLVDHVSTQNIINTLFN